MINFDDQPGPGRVHNDPRDFNKEGESPEQVRERENRLRYRIKLGSQLVSRKAEYLEALNNAQNAETRAALQDSLDAIAAYEASLK